VRGPYCGVVPETTIKARAVYKDSYLYKPCDENLSERRLKMKKRGLSSVAVASALVVTVVLVLSGAGMAAEFSADLLLKQAGVTMTGKVYVKGDKTRQEYVQRGQKQVMIFRFDKGIMWVLIPSEKIYMEMSSEEGAVYNPQLDQNIENKAEIKHLGKETINGYTCEKYQYIYHDQSMGTATQWFSKKLNYPLKTEYKSPSGDMFTEYKNIKEGKVDNSLFEVPGDYALMSLPGMR
jgi:outer membrane lipoprotein-sorting protein